MICKLIKLKNVPMKVEDIIAPFGIKVHPSLWYCLLVIRWDYRKNFSWNFSPKFLMQARLFIPKIRYTSRSNNVKYPRHVSTIIVSMFELRSCLDKKIMKQSLRLKPSTLPINNIFFPKKKEKTIDYIADEDRSLFFTLSTSLALSKRHQSY